MAVFMINECKFSGCDRTYPTLGDLIYHIEETHIGENMYAIPSENVSGFQSHAIALLRRIYPRKMALGFVERFAIRERDPGDRVRVDFSGNAEKTCADSSGELFSVLKRFRPRLFQEIGVYDCGVILSSLTPIDYLYLRFLNRVRVEYFVVFVERKKLGVLNTGVAREGSDDSPLPSLNF